MNAGSDVFGERDGERLVWCDIETTGLNPNRGMLLEVGFKITDLELNVIDDRQVLYWSSPEYDDECVKDKIDPFVWNMHKESHLWDHAKAGGSTPYIARTWVTDWLKGHGINKTDPLCGSSVQFDRSWLDVWIPEAIGLFSYRNIDISSVKELCKRYNPELYGKLDAAVTPRKLHRVMPDLEDTIEEFKFYRDNFLFWKD